MPEGMFPGIKWAPRIEWDWAYDMYIRRLWGEDISALGVIARYQGGP